MLSRGTNARDTTVNAMSGKSNTLADQARQVAPEWGSPADRRRLSKVYQDRAVRDAELKALRDQDRLRWFAVVRPGLVKAAEQGLA